MVITVKIVFFILVKLDDLTVRYSKCPSVTVVSCRSFRVADNGLGIGEVGAFKEQMFNLVQMLIRIPMFKYSTSAPILPIPKPLSAALFSPRYRALFKKSITGFTVSKFCKTVLIQFFESNNSSVS
jgi:hypothetical protein